MERERRTVAVVVMLTPGEKRALEDLGEAGQRVAGIVECVGLGLGADAPVAEALRRVAGKGGSD
jgi:hypothetical protein